MQIPAQILEKKKVPTRSFRPHPLARLCPAQPRSFQLRRSSSAVLRPPLCEELWPAPGSRRERDVNEGAWSCTASQRAPEQRLAAARRKNDVMQMKGRAWEARAPPPPFGVSVPVFSSGESQTGFHRESLQITSILARRKQNLHPAGSTPLSFSLSSPSLSLSLPPFLSPSFSPLPPHPNLPLWCICLRQPASSSSIRTEGKKHLWLGEKEGKKRKRKKTCLVVENDT
uniref:Uncharacterized protein n=1 Tax=Pipistrellus kuhlii TaxID=59472 RepID=A0A7J7XAT0_PIPKU|nr:hypothetical protein mPipKuh1_010587 [Pipistrellus kuhlii]